MFDAVCALHRDLYKSSISSEMPADKREKVLFEVIVKLAENMVQHRACPGKRALGDIQVNILGSGCPAPSCSGEDGETIIDVPQLWLKKFSELFPRHTRLHRKKNESFKQYSNRLYAKAQVLSEDSSEAAIAGEKYCKKIFKFYLRNLEDEGKAKQIVAFALNHELAHAMRGDFNIQDQATNEAFRVSTVSLPIFFLIGISFGFSKTYSFGMALLASVATGCLFKKWREAALIKRAEIEADLTALLVMPETKNGAIHLFKNVARLERMSRFTHSDHPRAHQRIAYLSPVGSSKS